jgi:hypothetical protein
LAKSDITGSDFHRSAENELPDEEKCHQPTPFAGSKSFPQENIGAARSGKRGAKLAPDEPVGHADDESDKPAEK